MIFEPDYVNFRTRFWYSESVPFIFLNITFLVTALMAKLGFLFNIGFWIMFNFGSVIKALPSTIQTIKSISLNQEDSIVTLIIYRYDKEFKTVTIPWQDCRLVLGWGYRNSGAGQYMLRIYKDELNEPVFSQSALGSWDDDLLLEVFLQFKECGGRTADERKW